MGVAGSKRSALLSAGGHSNTGAHDALHSVSTRPTNIDQFHRWRFCQGLSTACDAREGAKPLSTPPSPRSGHTVCLVGTKAYLFGGCGRSAGVEDKCLNDLHAFDITNLRWEKIEPAGGERPAVRRSAAMCALDDGRFLLSGGAGDDPDHLRSDLYMFDVHTRLWTKLLQGQDAKPFCLCGQSAVLWQDSVLFFGGSTGLEYSNALYEYNLRTNRWRQLATTGPRPTPRYKHQAFIHENCMYIIGGGCFKPLCEDIDVHVLDLTTLAWSQVATRGNVPMARVAHTCAYDSADGGTVYMWGGFTAGLQCLRNFYKLSLDTHSWTAIKPAARDELSPSARSFHGSVFGEGSVYVFSGSNGSEKFSDVWRYQVRQTPPPLLTLAARAVLAQSLSNAAAAAKTTVCCSNAAPSSDVVAPCGCHHHQHHHPAGSHGSHFGSAFACRRRKRDASEDGMSSATPLISSHSAGGAAKTRTRPCTGAHRAPLSGQSPVNPTELLPAELKDALAHLNVLADCIV